jgi:hypothetical protein
MSGWRRANCLLVVALLSSVAVAGNAVAAFQSGQAIDPGSVLGGSIATLVFFSPLALLFVGVPLWLYLSRLGRVGIPTRHQAILTAPAFFVPGVLVVLALIALDGKIQSSSVYVVVLVGTFGASLLFGAIARLPAAHDAPLLGPARRPD